MKRINRLADDALRDPSSGRIDAEHRLVYLVDGADRVVLQARYHDERLTVRPLASLRPVT